MRNGALKVLSAGSWDETNRLPVDMIEPNTLPSRAWRLSGKSVSR